MLAFYRSETVVDRLGKGKSMDFFFTLARGNVSLFAARNYTRVGAARVRAHDSPPPPK